MFVGFIILFLSLISGAFLYRRQLENIILNKPFVMEPELYSQGERSLFTGQENFARDRGINSFLQGEFQDSERHFEDAVISDPNDPESWIYYNNSLAHQSSDMITLAAVVPIGERYDVSGEMLRGIAQAQNEYNLSARELSKPLLNIMVADDSNNPFIAERVAGEIVKAKDILGVIGHNSSTATEAALPIYEKNRVPIVSPTSTSTALEGDVFFRTIASDLVTGQVLADYAIKNDLKNVVVYFNPESSYSKSLTEAFSDLFIAQGGNVIREVDLTTLNEGDERGASREIASVFLVDSADAVVIFPNTKVISVSISLIKASRILLKSHPTLSREIAILGGDSLYNPKTLELGGKEAIGLKLAVPWFSGAVSQSQYAKSSKEMWQGQVSWRTALSYDATMIFLDALEDLSDINNISRMDLIKELEDASLSPYESSGYTIQFENNELTRPPVLVQVAEGKMGPPGTSVQFDLLEED